MELEKVDEIIERYAGERGALIQLLLDVQQELNWIPKEAVAMISKKLNIPMSQVYRVASFYKAMSLKPIGRHLIQVCLGTACHVRGGGKILEKVEEILKIKEGETTEDMRFTVHRVNCLGCCAMGPVMVVDKDYHGKITVEDVNKILERYE
ncbi:MAG: NADH-quinone oxidoreductase subunit NuoE [Candidatus Syntropharchaeia archaeon]